MGDPVNRPDHYNSGDIECIDAIEIVTSGHSGHLAYCLGNCIKYIWRSAYKGKMLQDLKKARWYLDRAISIATPKQESKVYTTLRHRDVFWDQEKPETD